MPKLDFSKIGELLKTTPDFSLTESQYKKLIGKDLPKNPSYLTKKSALAKFTKQEGFIICFQERTIRFEKTKKE